MSNDPGDDDRTVYQPKPEGSTSGGKPAAAEDDDRTRFEAPSSKPAPTSAPEPAPATPPEPPKQRKDRQFEEGEVLNGIYKITRFLARGGMGEVYEASNIHQQQERVAIKVMLPHLAQDELVAAMFSKEAEMLTRLHHEAIVPYRMSARDEEGKPYIVTEFIDGPSLEDKLGKIELSDQEFADLAQKLAAGLGTAHSLGAVHRDIAPDNILLADGDPARPKIIDFGIAKDARENTATIVGDGFAGKLKYVAPEQLGEYDRNVGPWSDIYSLALTLRALAAGKASDMGGSLSDAVRKRMQVPDLSDLPPRFHSAFELALQPDPADRPQSMAEFILRLAEPFGGTSATGFAPIVTGDAPGAAAAGDAAQKDKGDDDGALAKLQSALPEGLAQNKMVLIGGGVAALLLVVVAAVVIANLGGGAEPQTGDRAEQGQGGENVSASGSTEPTTPTQIAVGSPEFEQIAQAATGSVDCSWLTYAGDANGTARFIGGAANPAAAQTTLLSAIERAGAASFSIDMSDVIRFTPQSCAVLNALREVRSDRSLISTPQEVYEAKRQTITLGDGGTLPENNYARALVRIDNLQPGEEVALFQLDATEGVGTLTPNRQTSEQFAGRMLGNTTPNGFVLTFPVTFEGDGKQSYGVIAITGPSALPSNMIGQGTAFDEAWATRFRQGAQANGWKADTVWFSVEDRQRD
ncbi:MAG: serine/threonine-protein kinase [Pseudomonadota bacterium]